jgi:hypothetical protein
MTVSTLAPVTRALRAATPDASAARISALLYLSQAWCLGLTGRPLFLPDLIVDADKGTITADQFIATDVATVLTLDETVAVEAVAAFYSHHTDDQLRALIKVDVSWLHFEGHLRETASRTVVDEAGLRQTYALRSVLTGAAPIVTTSRDATDAEAAVAGLAVLQRWRTGLELLGAR